MVGLDFYYDNAWLSSYNLIMVGEDTGQAMAGRQVEKTELNGHREVSNIFTAYHSDVLTLTFSIIKNPCFYDDQKDMVFTGSDINEITGWLYTQRRESKLIVTMEDEEQEVWYYGVFTDAQPDLIGNVCYGLNLTFTCNAPYGFSPSIGKTQNLSSTPIKTIIYNGSTDGNYVAHPTFKFTGVTSASTFKLQTNDYTYNFNIPCNMTLDCEKKMAFDEDGKLIPLSQIGITYSQDFSCTTFNNEIGKFRWPEFKPGITDVKLSSNHNIDVVITTRFPIRAGGF